MHINLTAVIKINVNLNAREETFKKYCSLANQYNLYKRVLLSPFNFFKS